MKANYDHIAWFYDQLARLVYGRAIVDAQLYLVREIAAGSNILIAGGGTGWILDEIAKIHSSGLTITYVDASSKMIEKARKHRAGNNSVTFVESSIEYVSGGQYQVVITPFLFDNFTDNSLQRIFDGISSQLAHNGLWLYCDFQDSGKWWQGAMLKIMYAFFRVTCDVETSRLPDANRCFRESGYSVLREKTFLKDFIIARVYQKA